MATSKTQQAQQRLAAISRAAAPLVEYKKADGSVRHKCFLTYHAEDAEEVLAFVEAFDSVFIPKCLGVTEDDPWIDSTDTDYIMDMVRENYLSDSTVTIALVGSCTWARRYVDWEVYSSLRAGSVNRINGLLAIQLPSAVTSGARLPARVSDNVTRDANKCDVGYARYYVYPTHSGTLQSWVEDAFQARTQRPGLRVNSRERKVKNSPC